MITRRRFLVLGGAAAVVAACGPTFRSQETGQGGVSGEVLEADGSPVETARVTLFRPDLSYFREARTDAAGRYAIPGVPSGTYRLGASALGRGYREDGVFVQSGQENRSFQLGPDVHPGEWKVIGTTDPETFGGTNSGSILPDGRLLLCHDATDPILFDPATGRTTRAAPSASKQGCHMPTHLPDGRLLIVGGGTVDDQGNFGPGQSAVRAVKAYDVKRDAWEDFPDLLEPRWYPGLARLADARLLLFGGGQQPDASRTATCEVYDPASRTSTPTGPLVKAGGFGPAVLLHSGQVLSTWDPPQLYDPAEGSWRATGPFVQPLRAAVERCPLHHSLPPGQVPPVGDHPDHSAVMLADGSVLAIGIRRAAMGSPGSMVERYDPDTETWTLRSSPDTIRSMAEVVRLPTGKILVAGGKKEDADGPDPVNQWCQLKRVDLYDPDADTWQRMADMGDFREYHAITILHPDGRVLTTAGTREPGVSPPPGSNTSIEAFSPPYLFRGVRPRIDAISSTTLANGQTFTVDVSLTDRVTSLVMIGLSALSHWMEGGIPRLLQLAFDQTGTRVTATIPADPLRAMAGWYILYALVDDIPSMGRVVSIAVAAP